MQRRPALSRTGLTLLELLLITAIIGVLVALLLPAIQRVRESASRATCASNLKQIGLALQQFHDIHGFFPNNGGSLGLPGSKPAIASVKAGKPKWWGVGDPRYSPGMQPGSWAYAVLPYLEQQNAFQNRTYNVAVKEYLCPTRGRQNPQTVPEQDPVFPKYTYINDGVADWGKTDYAGNSRIITANIEKAPNTGTVRGIPNVPDGTSNTLLIGEKAMDTRLYNTGGWLWDEPIFAGGGAGGTVRSGNLVVRDAIGVKYDNQWGSAHPAGVQFLWVDGSVRLIAHGTSKMVTTALLTPDGGEVTPDPP
jgi:prepilin-type processing-associated H-X9-DG protein